MFTEIFFIFSKNVAHTTHSGHLFCVNPMLESDANDQVEESSQVVEAMMPAEFGLAMAIFVVLASMVGVGVLTTSGYTVALVGSNQLMLGLWIVGGVIAVCGALTLAELSAALPHTGGDFVYLYEAYGPLVAFLSGWVSFLIGFSGPVRGVGIRLGKVYSGTFWPRCKSSGIPPAPAGHSGHSDLRLDPHLGTRAHRKSPGLDHGTENRRACTPGGRRTCRRLAERGQPE